MPGMSGLEVLKKLRPDHPEPCVVILTALVDTKLAVEALKLGADDYLTKPWTSEDLSARLRSAQERREQARQDETQRPPSEEPADEGPGDKEIDPRQITEDLVAQQMTIYERLISRRDDGGRSRQRRRWWPWGRSS